jgi:hypothetical protein
MALRMCVAAFSRRGGLAAPARRMLIASALALTFW